MKLVLDLNVYEMAVLADALNLHRHHIENDEEFIREGWVGFQGDVERKFYEAGLVGHLDGMPGR